VARQRAPEPLLFVGRGVDFGDEVVSIVQGLDVDDDIVAATVRQVVTVPHS